MSSSNRDWWWKLAFKGWAPQKRLVRTGCWWQEFRCGRVTRQSFLGFISLIHGISPELLACWLNTWSTRMCPPDNCVLCWVVSDGRELTNHYCSPRCSRIRLEGSFQWADISACRVKVLLLFCSPIYVQNIHFASGSFLLSYLPGAFTLFFPGKVLSFLLRSAKFILQCMMTSLQAWEMMVRSENAYCTVEDV